MNDDPLVLEEPRQDQVTGVTRVLMSVGGADVWFESADVVLQPSVEGFASAFLIPALALGRRMVIKPAVSADWAANAARAMSLVCDWWKYPRLAPGCVVGPPPTARPLQEDRPTPAAGLAFSAGVDSLFTLLRSAQRVDALVFVQGLDMTLEETERAEQVRASLAAVATATGARAITIRTNLRTHPVFRQANWERTHGGALAAVGHMLRGEIDAWLISSSYQRSMDRKWGSRWDLDPLWSGAGMTIWHIGEQYSRQEKLEMLADSALARAQLRVCWENRDDRLNCSRCGKCVRTRLLLCALGVLDRFPTLDDSRSLAADLDGLPAARQRAVAHNYHFALARSLPSDVREATHRVLARMRREERRDLWRRVGRLPRAAIRRLLRTIVPAKTLESA